MRVDKKFKKLSLLIICLLVAFILSVTQSRTAILMVILFGVSFFYRRNHDRYQKTFQENKKSILSLLFGVLVICAAFFCFYVKQESVFGRLLIWQITLTHITDNLFTGIGIGNFPLQYPQWQIEYFVSHPNPLKSYFLNANEIHVAFNEYLQLLSETGVFIFLCFVVLFAKIFIIKGKKKFTFLFSVKAALGLILLSALFSYPLHSTSIFFVFIFSTAALSKAQLTNLFYLKLGNKYKVLGIAFFLPFFSIIILKSIRQTQSISKWETLREDFFLSANKIKIEYSSLYPSLKTNGKFLLNYGERLTNINEPKKATIILETSKKFYISYRTFISTANAYYKANNISLAINNLEKATSLIPSKFYSKYELVKLYLINKDTIKAKQLSNYILRMPVKQMSPEVIEIKAEALKIKSFK